MRCKCKRFTKDKKKKTRNDLENGMKIRARIRDNSWHGSVMDFRCNEIEQGCYISNIPGKSRRMNLNKNRYSFKRELTMDIESGIELGTICEYIWK